MIVFIIIEIRRFALNLLKFDYFNLLWAERR